MNTRSESDSGKGLARENHHWADLREAGTLVGLRFLNRIHDWFGRGILTLFLYPAMLYFAMVRPVARRASLDFLRTHYRCRPEFWSARPGFGAVIKHFMAFGQSILDKILAWTSDISHDDFRFPDREAVDAVHRDPRGRLVIGSHYGNLEYCRGYMERFESLPINILVHDAHSGNFAEMMARVNPDSRLNIYQVEDLDIALVLKLRTKVQSGEWLFIAGDRVPIHGTERTTGVSFLGRPARLPIGPYLLAQSIGCPVSLMFAYKIDGHINLDVVPLSDKVVIAREDREASLNTLAQRFADELAARCLQEPYQWFNFFDFWYDNTDNDKKD